MFMLFVVDFDGTISKRDTIDQLLEKFADPSWEALEKDWLDGKMTALECMSKQIDMVDSDLLSLENFFRSIQLDDTFLPFYDYVKTVC
jgi:2-hydroxy-3-keto-5-methylthiopentenyl-1-phosphate phosphatase